MAVVPSLVSATKHRESLVMLDSKDKSTSRLTSSLLSFTGGPSHCAGCPLMTRDGPKIGSGYTSS